MECSVILGDFKVTNLAKSLFLKYLHQMLYQLSYGAAGKEIERKVT